MSEFGRFCCKTPKTPFDQFPANGPNEPQSPIDVGSRQLPKSLVSSPLDNVVPQITVRSPRVRPENLHSVTQKDSCNNIDPERKSRLAWGWGLTCYSMGSAEPFVRSFRAPKWSPFTPLHGASAGAIIRVICLEIPTVLPIGQE
jgi:hypothetical protein